MGFLDTLSGGNIGKATDRAATKNKALLSEFRGRGNGIINLGETRSVDALNKGINVYSPYATAGRDATSLYSNALGLGGEEGNAAATDAFQAGPGYNFALEQGTNAALRGASAAGMLNSGNTLTALSQYGQGLANQEYGSWLDRLKGLSSQGLQAASGQAQGYGNLGSLHQSIAGDRLGLENTVAQGRIAVNNQRAAAQEQGQANKSSFFGGLLSGGLSLGGKLLSGGLF